jgi:hypothetical protein
MFLGSIMMHKHKAALRLGVSKSSHVGAGGHKMFVYVFYFIRLFA